MPELPSDLIIRRARDGDVGAMARLHFTAYPGFPYSLEERLERFRSDPTIPLEDNWVCLKNEQIVGQFSLLRYKMFRLGVLIPVGGISRVAVASEARREKIAYWMMLRAVQIMEQNGTPLSLLYPFQHRFYERLGWGKVGQTRRYRFTPSTLPAYPGKEHIFAVTTYDQQEEVMECYRRYAEKRNGLFERGDVIWHERILKNNFCFAWRSPAGQVEGYVLFRYRPLPDDKFLTLTDIDVWELVWNGQEAFKGLVSFLSSQSDQVRCITYYDQSRMPFEQIMSEPISFDGDRNNRLGAETATLGSNLMGRVVQLRRAIALGGGVPGVQGKVLLKITDDLNPSGPLLVEYDGKRVDFPKTGEPTAVLTMSISVFSAIYFGAMRLSEALWLGLAESEGETTWLDRVWSVPPTICLDYF